MARRRGRGRKLDGMLILDKPVGLSSNEALQQVKRGYGAAKAGHTGSLDPLASGVLPLCFGEATKFSQFLLDSDKRYLARLKLGVSTDSGDADGQVVSEREVGNLGADDVESALAAFRGEIEQVPSMFSAVKHQGQPLYKLARQGIEVERKSRRVTVFENRLVEFDGDELTLDIHCSKGTYVRNIAEDLGEMLGCGAHVIGLRRTQAGPFRESDLVTMEQLELLWQERGAADALLLPIAAAVRDWPEIHVADASAFYLKQGQAVLVPQAPTSGWVRLMETVGNDCGEFLGVGEILDDGRVAPRRLLQS